MSVPKPNNWLRSLQLSKEVVELDEDVLRRYCMVLAFTPVTNQEQEEVQILQELMRLWIEETGRIRITTSPSGFRRSIRNWPGSIRWKREGRSIGR